MWVRASVAMAWLVGGSACTLVAPFDSGLLDEPATRSDSDSPTLGFGDSSSPGAVDDGSGPEDGAGSGIGGGGGSDPGPACVPACDGRCGNDGCGGACPSSCEAGESCTIEGRCVRECTDTFRLDVASSIGREAVLADGALYVAGATSGTGWVSAYDACAGGLSAHADVLPDGARSSHLAGLVVTNDEVLATGAVQTADDAGEGLYVRLGRDALDVKTLQPLFGSTDRDDLPAIGIGPNGRIWMTGQTGADTTPASWIVEGSAEGQACGFAGPEFTSFARAILASPDIVEVAVDAGSSAMVVSYDAASCRPGPQCGCDRSGAADIVVGSITTSILDLLRVGPRLFVAGLAQDEGAVAGDLYGFVAEVDLRSGALGAVFRWDPSGLLDGFAVLATDGQRLYAGGARGWDGTSDGWSAAQGVIVALPLDLSDAQWVAEPADTNVVWGLAAAGASIFASGDAPDAAFVAKCTAAGVC